MGCGLQFVDTPKQMTSYKELIVWQQSYVFGLTIYKITKNFPTDEKFGLVSQLRRASVSIPSNIAEGSKRSTRKDYRSFLIIAYGSGAEIETQLLFSKDLGYIKLEEYTALEVDLTKVMKMLNVMIQKLEQAQL